MCVDRRSDAGVRGSENDRAFATFECWASGSRGRVQRGRWQGVGLQCRRCRGTLLAAPTSPSPEEREGRNDCHCKDDRKGDD